MFQIKFPAGIATLKREREVFVQILHNSWFAINLSGCGRQWQLPTPAGSNIITNNIFFLCYTSNMTAVTLNTNRKLCLNNVFGYKCPKLSECSNLFYCVLLMFKMQRVAERGKILRQSVT